MKHEKLIENRTLNPHPERVIFKQTKDFHFLDASDKAQVKYEMLRAVEVDKMSVSNAAKLFGYSRTNFYNVKKAFEKEGIMSLGDTKPGRKGPTKLTPEAIDFIQQQKQENSGLSGSKLAKLVESTFGINVTKRTIERLIKGMTSFKKNSI